MKNIEKILEYFDNLYPNPICALNFSNEYELLIAVILSAQCTDKRVNIVTKDLFHLASTPKQMIDLGETKLKQIIYPCGFYNAKAKAILSTSKDIIEKFSGKVPSTMDELTSLTGVGRKTANVVLGIAFGHQTIAVDTHVHRVSKRLNLAKENSTPIDCEMSLLKIIPFDKQTKFHHQTIWFGREHCKSQNPLCEDCGLKEICKYYKNKKNYKI